MHTAWMFRPHKWREDGVRMYSHPYDALERSCGPMLYRVRRGDVRVGDPIDAGEMLLRFAADEALRVADLWHMRHEAIVPQKPDRVAIVPSKAAIVGGEMPTIVREYLTTLSDDADIRSTVRQCVQHAVQHAVGAATHAAVQAAWSVVWRFDRPWVAAMEAARWAAHASAYADGVPPGTATFESSVVEWDDRRLDALRAAQTALREEFAARVAAIE